MLRLVASFVALFLLAVSSAAAEPRLTISFQNQSMYDGGSLRGARRERVVGAFDRFFHELAARNLQKGQSLQIDVLDIDLAGYGEPFISGFGEPRILTDATPPRFKLRYTLRQKSRVLTEGTEVVRDPNYLWNPSARLSQKQYVYEKEMLARWFRDRFVRLRPQRG